MDCIGARIVVADLSILCMVRSAVDDPELLKHYGFSVIRVENKFVSNMDTIDPYRAVHFIMQMEAASPADSEASRSGLVSFELQLKTFPSMIASDLYHNVIYKNLLPQMSLQMTDTIKLYAWQNVYHELTSYYSTGHLRVQEALSPLSLPPPPAASFGSCSDSPPPPASSLPVVISPALTSSSNHFKRKAISMHSTATDKHNLMLQLFNCNDYSGNLKLHLIDVNTIFDLLLVSLTSTSIIADSVCFSTRWCLRASKAGHRSFGSSTTFTTTAADTCSACCCALVIPRASRHITCYSRSQT
jgi:hypothetical protein